MKKIVAFAILGMLSLSLFQACSSSQSLQEYYVDNSENPNFLSLDVPVSILNLDEVELSDAQKEALSSLRKLNLLAFKKTEDNQLEYQAEIEKVNAILKNKEYKELMKLNSEYGKGVVKYLGEDESIDEVVLYGNSKEKGFALVRVLGDDMNPAHLAQLIQVLQKADYNSDALGEIGEFLKS